ncbi:hypothetical protein CRV24_009825 [Beauveria bassiana]|nr:hypothetical protein CRV24_009825 [Beauveria bassiana]KAH8708121.1 hypothetical protein HC256_010268 [Beauveria bassiana]
MPIGDLLASISGGADKTSTTVRPNSAANIKRKASAELSSNLNKAPRVTPPAPAPAPKPTQASSAAQRYAGTAADRPSRPTPSKPRPAPPASSSSSANAAAAAAPAKAAPKKGSFAEILARGKAAQASMGQVGKIQHKKVENPPRRSKEDAAASGPLTAAARGKKPVAAPGYGGTSRPSQRPAGSGISNGGSSGARRPGAGSSSSLSRQRPPTSSSGSARKPAAAVEPEKKIKKAATATTGYAGTARPKLGTSDSKKRHHDVPRGGALLSAPKVRPRGGSKYDDEFDEDMDDFIDYDEEEEDEGGEPRYGYASDASSDMEAGMDDIYDEEDRAARIARLEDVREEKLEKRLKAAKEERRRRALGGYR